MTTARKEDIQLSILKLTAALIGVKSPRTSKNPTSPAARRMAEIYDITRDGVLELRPFSSARRKFELPMAQNTTDNGPGKLYHMPQDMVRLEYVGADNWRVDGDFIRADQVYGDVNCLRVVYNSNHTDVRFGASLKSLIAADLAVKVSMGIKQSAAAGQLLQGQYDRALVRASSFEASAIGPWEGIPYSNAELLTNAPEAFLESGRNYWGE